MAHWRKCQGWVTMPGLEVSMDGKVRYRGVLVATFRNRRGYRVCRLPGYEQPVAVHLMVMDTWRPNSMPLTYPLVDHINGNRMDARVENLRWSNHKLNSHNRKNVRGYFKRGDRYTATIRCEGKKLYLGTFDTKEEAKQAYREASARMHEVL